jgi:hypothetical protein
VPIVPLLQQAEHEGGVRAGAAFVHLSRGGGS